MKSLVYTLAIVLLSFTLANAQSYITLSDDIDVTSNSYLKIHGGFYPLQDIGNDGLIRINKQSNIIIDGDSVYADGLAYSGYLIKIDSSSNIQIRNFSEARNFNYAVYITNSRNIIIENNCFSGNKTDSAGWINVWTGYTSALGGGVMMYNCDSAHIFNNVMKLQNDGVSLYNCRHIEVNANDFSHNTSYGVRMYYSDHNYIHHIIANNINRPLTDPSDCAALLMIVSNENIITNNDFSFSGDGIFLGQYQHSGTPNNNVFRYNNCSGSPHNAIEATYADGNTFINNLCTSSYYGMWLGYSYNTIVDSNIITDNHHSGIAVDRGFNNYITNNVIAANPVGIELWDGNPPSSGYSSQTSHDYNIRMNWFYANTEAVYSRNTENLKVIDNYFEKNYKAIYIDGIASGDTIISNYFKKSTCLEIENNSIYNIYAIDNKFGFSDTNYISSKIFDKQDDYTRGNVIWKPYVTSYTPVYVTSPPVELSEPPAEWLPYPEICGWIGKPLTLEINWDCSMVMSGNASLHLVTGTGWYVDVCYRPDTTEIAEWDLSDYGYLSFLIKSVNTNFGQFQNFHVRLGNNSGGYFRYNSTGLQLNQSVGMWKNYTVPIFGSTQWPRQQEGNVSLEHINYIEIWADTYGEGYEMWIDELKFLLATGDDKYCNDGVFFEVFPNPANSIVYLNYNASDNSEAEFSVFDVEGRQVILKKKIKPGPMQEIPLDGLSPGIYAYRFKSCGYEKTGKLCIQR